MSFRDVTGNRSRLFARQFPHRQTRRRVVRGENSHFHRRVSSLKSPIRLHVGLCGRAKAILIKGRELPGSCRFCKLYLTISLSSMNDSRLREAGNKRAMGNVNGKLSDCIVFCVHREKECLVAVTIVISHREK